MTNWLGKKKPKRVNNSVFAVPPNTGVQPYVPPLTQPGANSWNVSYSHATTTMPFHNNSHWIDVGPSKSVSVDKTDLKDYGKKVALLKVLCAAKHNHSGFTWGTTTYQSIGTTMSSLQAVWAHNANNQVTPHHIIGKK